MRNYNLGGRWILSFRAGRTRAGRRPPVIGGGGRLNRVGEFLSPAIPLPDGDRVVLIETRNTLTNETERRVARDFLDWRRELRTIEGSGGVPAGYRNLIVGNAAPEPILVAEVTATAFRTARVSPLLGRGLLDSDERPGAPAVVMLGYDVWQRSFGGRHDVVGSVVKLGSTPATVIGVMPAGFNTRTTTLPGRHCSSAHRTARSRAVPSASSAGWLLASRASARTPSSVCSGSGPPQCFRRRTRISGRA